MMQRNNGDVTWSVAFWLALELEKDDSSIICGNRQLKVYKSIIVWRDKKSLLYIKLTLYYEIIEIYSIKSVKLLATYN